MQTKHSNLHDFIQLAVRSFELDIPWLFLPYFTEKYMFLWKKYIFLVAYPLFWHRKSKAYRIKLWGRYMFLENRENLGVIQSVFIYNAHLKHSVPPGATVIDIGAHIGEFALFCNVYLKAKTIYSFEPIATSYRLLQKNKPEHSYPVAIGAQDTLLMHIPKHTVMASTFSSPQDTRQEYVTSIPLDTMPEVSKLHSIDLFKIDVEGMEYDVLGASKDIIPKSKYILMEASIDRPASKSTMETLQYLQHLVPDIKLIHIGQMFGNETHTDAADMLFYNPSYLPRT